MLKICLFFNLINHCNWTIKLSKVLITVNVLDNNYILKIVTEYTFKYFVKKVIEYMLNYLKKE